MLKTTCRQLENPTYLFLLQRELARICGVTVLGIYAGLHTIKALHSLQTDQSGAA